MDVVIFPNSTLFLFPFEERFDFVLAGDWFERNWRGSTIYLAGLYLLFILSGPKWMAQRPAYSLRGPLICWNLALAIFSIIGTYRTLPNLFQNISHKGVYASICLPGEFPEEAKKLGGFWSIVFIMSKLPELGDTVFIVLRKQPLIFLHWYHHVTVLLYTWLTLSEFATPNRISMVMNFTVHSAMYSYYALRAARYSVPRIIAMAITIGQLTQMWIGCIVFSFVYYWKLNGEACRITDAACTFGFLMYFSYAIFFFHFFYNSYIRKPITRKMVAKDIQMDPSKKSL